MQTNPYVPSAKPRPGFREHASGLMVPEEISRACEVWTRDEFRLLERATKLLERRGIDFYMGCQQCRKDGPIEAIRQPDGSVVFRCAHKDRVMQKAF